jgi:hypothetical protein
MKELSPEEHILGIVINHWQACSVGAAAELELADHLAEGPLPVEVLAERTQTHAPFLFRLLRALESTGIFTQVSPGVFANSPASERLRRHAPNSNWAWIRTCLCSGSNVYEGWRGIMHTLKSGEPGFEAIVGQPAWEWLQQNPEKHSILNEAMRDLSASISPAVAAAYDWSRFPVIADIGGGIGSQLMSILDAHPSCRGILFDQPSVVAEAPEHDRIECVGGNFFEQVPIEADAYMMRWILHDWSDEECLELIANVKSAAKPGSRLVVIDSVIPETSEPDMGKWMDLNMMVNITGRERTAVEFRELMHEAGFEVEEIVPTASPLGIVIARQSA